MTTPERDPSLHEDPAISPGLKAALGRLDAAPGSLAELDARVLGASRAHMRSRRRRRQWLSYGSAAAAAALIASAALIWVNQTKMIPNQMAHVDEPVTILKAFALARLLEQRSSGSINIDSSWDASADGRIDQLDVDALAAAAVRLSAADMTRTGGGT